MNARRLVLLAAAVGFVALAAAAPAVASAGSLYDIKASWGDTNLTPGSEGQFTIQARNIGDESSSEPLTITDQLPPSTTITGIASAGLRDLARFCSGVTTSTLACTVPGPEVPIYAPAPGVSVPSGSGFGPSPGGYLPKLFVDVAIDPGASGTETNRATISGGGAANSASDVDQVPFSPTPSSFGIVPGSFEADFFDAPYPSGSAVRQAGSHPFELRLNFDLNQETGVEGGLRYSVANGHIKDAEVTLPRGTIGNPESLPKCDPVLFATQGAVPNSTGCPADTQVGYLNVALTSSRANRGSGQFDNPNEVAYRVAIYNLVPPQGTPVDFGFQAGTLIQGHIYAQLDPAHDYAIKTLTPDITSFTTASSTQATFWGVPGDPAHDRFRYFPKAQEDGKAAGAPWGSAPIRPFFTLPMDCGFENGGTRIRIDSYEHPGEFTPVEEWGNPLDVSGCQDPRFRFEPKISLQPSDRDAGAPTGLDVHLAVPQRDDEAESAAELYSQNDEAKAIATPPIKKAVVRMPEGMTLSPSAAQGLGSCTSAQISLGTNEPVRCPDNSQYGTLTLHTPTLPESTPPTGFIYIAKQGDNPFHNFLSIYLVIEEPERGILIKIPGRIDLNPENGQITITFDELPQFPVSDMQMSFKGGVRAGLVEPSTCGEKTITAEFFTWQNPSVPVSVKSSYDITQKPDGAPCLNSLGERPFKPEFSAGTENNAGGSYSPFTLRLTRTDEDQEFSQLGVTLPPGLAARFAGVGTCPESGIALALSRETTEGAGALEQADPSCPASSLVGTTVVGAGVGVPLSWVPGKVYLAGPYKGAPLSLVVTSPTIVGPFDLGVITVRTALRVNPATAQGEVLSDPFPQIFQGIPVRIRDIRLNLDRPDFTLNPTSCAEKRIAAHLTGTGGDLASTADDTAAELFTRFQAADCASLGFRPKLTLRLSGGTHRSAHPALRATLKMPHGGANIATSSVALPHSEFLDQGSLNSVCTRVQFAGKDCPAGSVYGHAVARTPLFDFPLEGNVYLGTGYGHKLPDLVAELKGPASMPVEIDLDGRIDEVHGGIRTTFETVPDAPVSSFTLSMRGGKLGLIENSTELCAHRRLAVVKFTAQNGKRTRIREALKTSCKSRKHGGHKGGRKGH